MTTWTHNGKPIGAKPRPWRLTRRERVEMEAVLARVRSIDDAQSVYVAARLLGCDPSCSAWWPGYRVARARVAIALRAALRADEDARCEAALGRAGYGEETGATPGDGWDLGYDEGADAVVTAMREWPALDRGWSWTVPLALWETP